jgi:hypothetical protein
MKKLTIQNIDASQVATQKIGLPSEADLKVASLLGGDGKPLVKYWFDFSAKYMSPARDSLRNKAQSGAPSRLPATNFSGNFSATGPVVTMGNGEGVDTAGVRFVQAYSPGSGWTVFAVVNISAGLAEVAFTGIVGYVSQDQQAQNLPCVRVHGDGSVRVYGAPYGADFLAKTANDSVSLGELTLITVTHQAGVGVTIRINGEMSVRYQGTEAKRAPTGDEIAVLGSTVASGQFNGVVGEIILSNEGLDNNQYALSAIEEMLMVKYGIV